MVDGSSATLGQSVTAGAVVELDGHRYKVTVGTTDHARVLMYHKPLGQVTTRSDPEGRPTVFEKLPRLRGSRWVAVGRLDINTSGLLLLSTDGELVNALTHPSHGVDREYLCRVHGTVTDEIQARLRRGVTLEDGPAAFNDIVPGNISGDNQWFHVVLLEGRNREVRRLWESQGMQVSRLKRVRYGPVFLPASLRQGHYRELSPGNVKVLREDAGLPPYSRVLELEKIQSRRR